MGKVFDEINSELSGWIKQQHLFFVATAPSATDGLINCSPKGHQTLEILGPREVAYLDLTGSGIETAAHLQDNGRIVIMLCAFTGPPRIVRLQGTGDVITAESSEFTELRARFQDYPGVRAIIRVRLSRISDTCGYSVPLYEYQGERDTLIRWAQSKGDAGLSEYRREKNSISLDGLPGLFTP